MKKIFLLGIVCLLAVCAAKVYEIPPIQDEILTDAERTVIENKNSQKARSAHASAEWIHMNRGEADPSVVAQVRADIAQRRLAKADGLLDWEEMGPNNIGGRTRAILFDRDNPNKIIVGGVAGGLWLSTNSGQLWTPIEDSFEKGCIAVSSITQTSNGDIYVGTGEGFYFLPGDGTAGVIGSGIYKSTDGGVTWNLCNGTQPPLDPANAGDDWATVDKLAAHPTNPAIVYAATQGGMYMTKSAGASWERIKNTSGGNITGGRGWDVKAGSDGKVHFFSGTKYYRSVADDVFEEMAGGNIPTTGGRKVLSIQESDPNLLYVGTEGGFCISSIKRSTDGGTNWETIAIGSVVFHPGGGNPEQCQAGYDFAICAHPTNPDIVFVAGVVLWRGIRQASGGWDWQQIDSWFDDPTSINYVHADKHDIVFKPGTADEMYVVSDGGVSRSQNASDLVPVFEVRNKNYNVTQFYSVSADIEGKVMGGTQDNGSLFLNCSTNSANTAVEVWGGDGGFSEISNINPNAMYVGNPDGELYRSGNGGEGFGGSLLDCNIDCLPGDGGNCSSDGVLDDGGAFVTPFYLWEDAELFHKIKGATLGPNDQVTTISHGGQSFVITRNSALIPDDANEIYSDMKATLAESQIFIEWDEEKNEAKDYGPNDFRYVRSRMYIGDQQGGLWMSQDALNFQTTPFWTRIGDALGPVRCITSSPDGNTVWVGARNGTLLRVNNLDNIDINEIKLNDNDNCNTGIAEFMDFAGTIPASTVGAGSRVITGIATHPFDVNKVYCSAGIYGASSHVFEISNAADSDIGDVEVDDISGNLPKMPVYDLVVTNPQGYIVAATEYGMWLGDLSQPEASMWTEENGGDLHPVPVFRVREEGMAKVDPGVNTFCRVIYAGTHGRGAFRTTSLTNGGCGQAVVGGCQIVFSGVEEIAETELNVFPNPASDFATVNFQINESQELQVSVYALTGQLVNRINRFEAYAGNNKVEINVGDVPNGEYIVVLRAGDYQASTKLNVAH